jgi:hypothetical protein
MWNRLSAYIASTKNMLLFVYSLAFNDIMLGLPVPEQEKRNFPQETHT